MYKIAVKKDDFDKLYSAGLDPFISFVKNEL